MNKNNGMQEWNEMKQNNNIIPFHLELFRIP